MGGVRDNYVYVIPTEPQWRPTSIQHAAALAALGAMTPRARQISAATTETPTFFDAGANTERVTCPACGTELDWKWFGDRMNAAYAIGFSDLRIVTPCCATATTLNDLIYEWPMGFACWAAEVWGPNRFEFDATEIEALSKALGHGIRVVYTHR